MYKKIGIFFLILLIIYVAFFNHGNIHNLYFGVWTWLCIVFFLWADYKYNLQFPKMFFIVFITAVIVSYVFGEIFSLYKLIPVYDKAQHILYPVGLAILLNHVYKRFDIFKFKHAVLLMVFFTIVTSLVGFEIVEYSGDAIFGTHLQGVYNIKGEELQSPINDTMIDIILGTIMAAASCVIIYLKELKKGELNEKNVNC